MGFTHRVNDYVAEYCAAAPDRLIPMGGVHPRFAEDAAAEVRRAAEMGVRALKLHPPPHGGRAQRLPPRARRAARDLRGGAAAEAARDDPHRHLDLPRGAQPGGGAHARGRRGRGLPRPDADPRPRRPPAVDGAGLLPGAPLPPGLHGRLGHPARRPSCATSRASPRSRTRCSTAATGPRPGSRAWPGTWPTSARSACPRTCSKRCSTRTRARSSGRRRSRPDARCQRR